VNVVPAPSEIVVGGPSFDLGPRTTIGVGGLERLGKTLRAYLAPATSLALPLAGPGANQIRLRIDRQLHESPEGYRLEVLADGVEIVGAGEAGVFYGIQTLRQLLPEEIYASTPVADVVWRVPGVVVVDAPRFAWRGALLDVSRHFFPADYVRRFIDLLAVHKLNTLHLHLTDDPGWRLEISAYPRLTEIGAWREGSMVGHTSRRLTVATMTASVMVVTTLAKTSKSWSLTRQSATSPLSRRWSCSGTRRRRSPRTRGSGAPGNNSR
jgi:hexosaminidase